MTTDDPVLAHRFEPNPGAQSAFLRSPVRYPMYAAGQGAGKTWAGSAKLVVCHSHYVGTDSLCTAPTYQNIRQFTIPALADRLTEAGISHHVDLSEMVIRTPSLGSKILLHSAVKAERITGFEVGRCWIDEPARMPDHDDPKRNVWKNCVARTRDPRVPPEGWQIFATGTHEGKGTWVYSKWETGDDDDYEVYRGATTENPTSVEYAKQLVKEYGPELAEQYVYGMAVEESMSAIPYDVIAGCQLEECQRKPDWHHLEHTQYPLYAGVDIGRSKSLTVIWIFGQRNGIAFTEAVIEMRSQAFAEQREMIYRVLRLPTFRTMAMDSTYNPQLAEEAESRFGARVMPVIFNQDSKIRLAQGLERGCRGLKLAIPDDDDIIMDWYSVKRVVSKSGVVQYTAPYTSDGHADRFWAAALGFSVFKAGGVAAMGKQRDFMPRKEALRRF